MSITSEIGYFSIRYEWIIEWIWSCDLKKKYEINFLHLKINFHFKTIPCFNCTFNLDIHKNKDVSNEILFYIFCLFSYKIITYRSSSFVSNWEFANFSCISKIFKLDLLLRSLKWKNFILIFLIYFFKSDKNFKIVHSEIIITNT